MIKDILNYNISEAQAKEIARATGLELEDVIYSSDQLKYNSLADKKLNKTQRRDYAKRIKKYEDAVNRKIEREIRRYSGNPDAQKMVYREIKRGLANAEKYSTNADVVVIPDYIMDDIIEGKSSAEMKIVNRNFSHNEQKLIDSLKINIDLDKIETRQDYSLVAHSLSAVRDRGALVASEIAPNVYANRRELKELEKLIKDASVNKIEYQKKLAQSEVEGHDDIYFTPSTPDFSLRGIRDYQSYLNRLNQIKKYADSNYYEDRAKIYKDNYITAAYTEMPYSAAKEIEGLVDDVNWVDFMKLAETHPAAQIDFMYANGGIQHDLIVETLKSQLQKEE